MVIIMCSLVMCIFRNGQLFMRIYAYLCVYIVMGDYLCLFLINV